MDDFTYTETEFNHSKLCNFISSWNIAKNPRKRCRKFFLRKIIEICKEIQGWNMLYIARCDVT